MVKVTVGMGGGNIENRAGGDEQTGGGISHSDRKTRRPLAHMKGYFNWVSDACLILFSILILYNVHNKNKWARRGRQR